MSKPPLLLTPGITGSDGISRLSREITSAVSRIFGACEVWSWADATASERSGVLVRCAARRYTRIVGWALKESLFSQRGRPVVVLHAHLTPLALPLVARGARLVQFLLGVEVFRRIPALRRASLLRASKLASISRFTSEEFRRANPEFARSDIAVCHPGLPDLPLVRGPVCTRFALTVGRMSRDERYKGHDELLEAWPDVLRQVDDAELVVVGGGDDRERLHDKAVALGLGARVRFEGPIADESLERFYAGCQFFVMPSSNEGFGLVFLEAMRAGRPVIGLVGAAAEIIEDGRTGYLLETRSRSELVERVVTLFRRPELCEAMGARAREAFLTRFTSDHLREKLAQLLSAADNSQ